MKTASELHHSVRQSREQLTREWSALKEELNFSKRLRYSIQRKPWSWIGGATLVGLSIAFLKTPKRSQKEAVKVALSEEISSHLESKPSSSRMGPLALTALSLLKNNAVRESLFSTARFLLPMAQEAVTSYVARRKEKADTQEWKYQ